MRRLTANLLFLFLLVGFIHPALSSAFSENSIDINFHKIDNDDSGSWDKERLWTQKQICELGGACFDEEEKTCYPSGYIKNSKYCGFDSERYKARGNGMTFIDQSESGETCTNDFECKSNFCFNQECVSSFQVIVKDILLRISDLEKKVNSAQLETNTLSEEKETGNEIRDLSMEGDEQLEEKRGFFDFFNNLLGKE